MWDTDRQRILEPPLVTTIDDQLSLIDGHSRVFVAFEHGVTQIEVDYRSLEEIEGSTALYKHIHRAGPGLGINTISDLTDRIVSAEDHQKLWVGYCNDWLIGNDS